MNWDAIVWILLVIFGVASIGGGLVLYLQSRRVGWRAVGMTSVAGGVAALLAVALTVPLSKDQAPEPAIVGDPELDQLKEAPTAGQGPTSPAGDAGPPIPHGTPRLNLTYEGVVYYAEALSDDDAANLDENDLELVGATTESNKLSPGGGESLKMYRLKDWEEGYVYTVEPGRSFQNEDGNTITIEAEWIRWAAADPNGT